MTKKTLNGAEVIVDCLKRHGVEYIFAYPGGAAIPIFDALVDSPIKMILTRHEQGATHMADVYARVTGKPGVVLVTSGPGATNTLTGISKTLAGPASVCELFVELTDFVVVFLLEDELPEAPSLETFEVDEDPDDDADMAVPSTVNIAARA